MGKSINQTFNYKETMQMLKDKNKRKGFITAANAEASIKILAGQLLYKTNPNQTEIDKKIAVAKDEVKNAKSGVVSALILKTQAQMLKDRIDTTSAMIDELQALKDSKGGVLIPAKEQKLKEMNNSVRDLTEQRKNILLKVKSSDKE